MADEEPKRRGCFFYGCLTLIVLIVGGAVTFYFGAPYVASRAVISFTDPAPAPLPPVEVSEDSWQNIQSKVDTFIDSLKEEKPKVDTLALTGDDINAFIAKDSELKEWKDRVRVSIEGIEIKSRISVPLKELGIEDNEKLPWPFDQLSAGDIRGRYLNGTATFRPTIENGNLVLHIQSIEVKGSPLPRQMIEYFEEEALKLSLGGDAESKDVLENLESVKVEDGKIVLKRKTGAVSP